MLSHPKVDRALFKDQKVIQNAQAGQGFPKNQSIGVVKWKYSLKSGASPDPPISFTVWVSEAGTNTWNITVEYEWAGGDPLRDVTVSIPYATTEPSIASFDAIYEVSGDSIDWTIGAIDGDNANGTFEFEAQAKDESEFFPMSVSFTKTRPFVDIDVRLLHPRNMTLTVQQVASVTLLSMNQDINFSKEVKSVSDSYKIV